ncbi:MAG TPA: four helix bundle protein [Chryseosolibacter sp.]
MALIKSFEELDCWKVSRELRLDLSNLIKPFPKEEKFELVSQIRRASRSVTNNIAEGFGRYHYKEFIRFCRMSRGSLTELADHLIIAHDEDYITTDQLSCHRDKIAKAVVLINGFIKYLEKRNKDTGSSKK